MNENRNETLESGTLQPESAGAAYNTELMSASAEQPAANPGGQEAAAEQVAEQISAEQMTAGKTEPAVQGDYSYTPGGRQGGYEYRQSFAGQQAQNQGYQNPPHGQQYGQPNGAPYGQPYGYYGHPYGYQQPAEPQKKKSGIGKRAVALVVCCCIICAAIFGVGGMILGQRYVNSEAGVVDNKNPALPGVGSAETDAPDKNDPAAPDREGAVIYEAAEGSSVGLGNGDPAAEVYKKASPSVVEITTETRVTSSFIGQYVTEGAGSGVILSENGYIITNNHVISGASNITVRTSDGQNYPAALIGTDEQSDIAILKVEAEGLTPCVLGRSSDLMVGQSVFAIGNPLGTLGGSITDGIISALSREVTIEGQTMNLLQTNTAINPGNSGGGLFNANGDLIAIVNAKSAGSDIEGLGFAIPIDSVRDTIDQLIEFGYIRGRAAMNITYIEVSNQTDYWDYINSEIGRYITDYGVYVLTSQSDVLQFGDRIVAFDGVSISVGADIKALLTEYSVGDTVDITVVRAGRMKTVQLTLGEYVPQDVQNSTQGGN